MPDNTQAAMMESAAPHLSSATNVDGDQGVVGALWRYPVKSMMGEELNVTSVTEKGILGDRAYALKDAQDGKIVSAKNPRKWPDMFSFRAMFESPPNGTMPPVLITLPDGTQISSTRSDLNDVLSGGFGRAVTFETVPPEHPELEEYWPDGIEGLPHNDFVTDEGTLSNTFFDLSTIHILTTSTLEKLRELYPQGRFEVRRFRPNIVVNTTEKGFVENAWIGKTVSIGDVVFEITGRCPRCVMTTVPQYDLPKDSGILRAAVQHNEGGVGVYAKVLQGGTIRRGDKVTLKN